MKRIILALTILYLFCFLFIPPVQAQEKKTEKKIKIVTVDENGKKVVIDTVLTGDMNLEDLDLPEGIIIQKKDDHSLIVTGDDTKNIYVTIDEKGDILTIDEKGNISTKEDEDIFQIKKGNVMILKKGEGDTFTIYETSDKDEEDHKVVVYTISEGDTIKKEARMYAGKHENIAWVSEGGDEDIHIHDGKVFIEKGDKNTKAFIISVDESGKEKVKNIGIMKGSLDEGEKEIIIRSSEGEEIFKIKGDVVIKIQGDKVKVEKEEKNVKEKKEEKK